MRLPRDGSSLRAIRVATRLHGSRGPLARSYSACTDTSGDDSSGKPGSVADRGTRIAKSPTCSHDYPDFALRAMPLTDA